MKDYEYIRRGAIAVVQESVEKAKRNLADCGSGWEPAIDQLPDKGSVELGRALEGARQHIALAQEALARLTELRQPPEAAQ